MENLRGGVQGCFDTVCTFLKIHELRPNSNAFLAK